MLKTPRIQVWISVQKPGLKASVSSLVCFVGTLFVSGFSEMGRRGVMSCCVGGVWLYGMLCGEGEEGGLC